jgi:hypothetical protein
MASLKIRYSIGLVGLWLFAVATAFAQPAKNTLHIKNGRMVLTLYKNSNPEELSVLNEKYNFDNLDLQNWVVGKNLETVEKSGWKIDKIHRDYLVLSRGVEGLGNIAEAAIKVNIAGIHQPGGYLHPLGVYVNNFGYNRLKNQEAIVTTEGKATFWLEGYPNAAEVKIAGSFTRWQFGAKAMKKEQGGWRISLPLEKGKHYYKFIVDGRWILHAANEIVENDGRGNNNSVFFMPNYWFRVKGLETKRKVYVAGSFNGWIPRQIALQKNGGLWELPVFLPEGTHTYRLIADQQWMADPSNTDRLPNEFNDYNSVVRIGKPFVFMLEGFSAAKEVFLKGSFNQWRDRELFLTKTDKGWLLPYTPGAGNHFYHYVVDGKKVGPPPQIYKAGEKPVSTQDYTLVIGANHTLRLPGFGQAKEVFVSGSFNNWAPRSFAMEWRNNGWEIKLCLPPGKHSYKFVVDGQWMIDPANKWWEDNGHGDRNSVIWVDNEVFDPA